MMNSRLTVVSCIPLLFPSLSAPIYTDSGLLTRADVVQMSSDEIAAAIEKSATNIDFFRKSWSTRRVWQDLFVAVGASSDADGTVRFRGVLVQEIDDAGVLGLELMETLPFSTLGRKIRMNWSEVIDWRFRDRLALVGGEVFKTLSSKLAPFDRRRLREMSPFSMGHPTKAYEFLDKPTDETFRELQAHEDLKSIESIVPKYDRSGKDRTLRVATTKLTIGELACLHGNVETVEFLIAHSAIPRSKLTDPYLVMFAMQSKTSEPILDLLIRQGVDLDGIDPETGWTALHAAIANNQIGVAKVLLKRGASTEIRSFDDRSPIYFATTPTAVQLLLDYGASLKVKDSSGMTPIEYFKKQRKTALLAAAEGRTEATKDNSRKARQYTIGFGGVMPMQILK